MLSGNGSPKNGKMKTDSQLSKVSEALSEVDWTEYDIKLTRMQLLNAKKRDDQGRVRRLSSKLDRLWREKFR